MAKRLPSVVACAATLCERPAITSVVVLGGEPRRAGPGRPPSGRGSARATARIWSCSTFSVRSRRGHALVDVLVAGERGELLDPRLHVVAGDPLAGGDARRGRPGRRPPRRPRRRRRARRRRGRAAPRARRSRAGARARSCARATRSRPGRRRRSGWRGRWGRSRLQPSWSRRPDQPSRRCRCGDWAPSKEISATPSYAWARASATSAPTAVTARTRPPAVTSARRRRRGAGVDARRRRRRSRRRSRPAMTSPGATASRGSPGGHTTATAAPRLPRQAAARRRGCRSAAPMQQRRRAGESSSASSGWVSGSPKRALNSTTRRPREVSASPAYSRPCERRAAPGHLVDGGLQDRAR